MAPASVNSSSGSAPGRRRVFFVPMDMGEGSACCLVWCHEQWASFGLNCVLCWADRGEIDLAHHYSLAISCGQPEPTASGVFHRWNSQSSDHHAAGLQTSNGQTTSSEAPDLPKRRRSNSQDGMTHGTHACPALRVARWRWRWRHRRDPACRNDNRHHPNSRTRRRAAVAGWTREVTAESGRHTLQPRQVGRVWSRLPDLTDGSRNLSLSSCLATTGRPAAGQASWCGTVVVPRCPVARRFQRSWRPKAHSSMAPETPPAPCRMPDTGPDRQLAVPSPAPVRQGSLRLAITDP